MSKEFDTPLVPVSWGELIDKITILEIKLQNIASESARKNIKLELEQQNTLVIQNIGLMELIQPQKEALSSVNSNLWRVEDDIREKERKKEFDSVFIELARSVYRLNDLRATIKREINSSLQSEIVEEKSYKPFQ
jgi:hypothetical protein